MAFDPSLKDDVIKNADIVKVISAYQPLTQHGKEYIGLCPFHNDSSPSMHVSPSKRIFKCFACGTGGDAIGYVMKREGLSYFEAMKKVAEISGYHDPRLEDKQFNKPVDEAKVPLFKCLHDLTVYYQYALSTEEGKLALDYLDKRGLDSEIRNKYLLGYAFLDGEATIKYLQSKGHSLKTIEDVGIASISNGVYKDKNAGRVIFPILDKDGRVIGYSARTLHNDDAKYVNTQGTALFYKSNVLYNYNVAKDKAHLDGYVYVLEGFMDVFALHKIGIDSAVALMGTALT